MLDKPSDFHISLEAGVIMGLILNFWEICVIENWE